MPYGSTYHIPPTNYHFLTARQEPYQKGHLIMKHTEEIFGEKSHENGPAGRKKRQDRKSNGSRQKNKRGESWVKLKVTVQ